MAKEKLEQKAEENLEKRNPCEFLTYCPFYSKIISNEMRWKYCHAREEKCYKKERFKSFIPAQLLFS